MNAENLLNLSVSALFEQHSVSEIDVVHKKIQSVVENKREELRTMVGERYRDLLQAADTIAAMQESASTLIEQVRCVQNNCRSLNEQQLLGFKTTPCEESGPNALLLQRNANKQINNYYSTMVQIKLLTSLPELIWTHIDEEQFYVATELFIFSRHISTGLQLDAKNELMQKLPVARKQWEILRPFHVTIKQAVLAVLEREMLSPEVAVDCMQSLLLLDKCSLSNVLQTFLQLRATAFLNCLREQENSAADGDKRRRVKERILASLHILNGTIDLLDKCLLANGLLFSRIADCTLPCTPPTIERMDSSERQLSYLLPDIISGFRPKFDKPELSEVQLREALQHWLSQVDSMAAQQLQQLFGLVSNLQTIQDIKTVAYNHKHHSYAHLEQQLGLPHMLDFYTLKYVPLINARVREIIRSSWSAAIQATYEHVQKLVEEAQSTQLEIWQEQSSDLPLSLAAALNENLSTKRLGNKTKGYDGNIIQLCGEFDTQIAAIVQELNLLLDEQTSRAEDKLALIEFLRETAQQQLTHYISQVKTLALKLRDRQTLMYAIRSSLALVELCPHLKLCFCHQSSWRQWTGHLTAAGVEHWQRICALLEEEMLQLWMLVIDEVLSSYSCSNRLPLSISHDVMLSDFALWQTQTLEQRDEQEQTVQSTIRIPSQPRLSLQNYLFQLIDALNIAVPQTLPIKVLQAFNQKLLSQLLAHYQVLINAECTKSSQNIALQLYFDLKFMVAVFGVTREERSVYEQFQSLQRALRDYIDPFDFELFSEHITIHVSRSAARLHGELGVLTPAAAPATQTPANVAALAHEAEPNLLCLSCSGSTSLWFPLLPIVMPQGTVGSTSAAYEAQILGSDKTATGTAMATTTTTPTRKTAVRKTDTNKSKSSAASFFGMSQEWFR